MQTPLLLASVIAALVSALAGGSMPNLRSAEAGPNPCPPADLAVFFEDCFDLGDTNGGADDSDSSSTVNSDNEAPWSEAESGDGCAIAAEELSIRNASATNCTVTTDLVSVQGYSEITITFDWGYEAPGGGTFGVWLNQDAGGFVSLADLVMGQGSTCDQAFSGNCADAGFVEVITLEDCLQHSFELQFTEPEGVVTATAALVDDVRIEGTAQDCEGEEPQAPDIVVTKVCFGTGSDATFGITIGTQTETVPCGESSTLFDVPPGTYPVSEEISDPTGFTTLIFCASAPVVVGTSTDVIVPADADVIEDITCVILNNFDPEDDDGLGDLICSCTCCSLDLEIDVDNSNTNTFGIDNANTNGNANENPNTNTNEIVNTNNLDQNANQELNNTTEQVSNNTSSPEVNIDFD
jgi:hypothetical protein